MKLIKSDSKDEAEEIQEEASTHEEKIQEVVSIFLKIRMLNWT